MFSILRDFVEAAVRMGEGEFKVELQEDKEVQRMVRLQKTHECWVKFINDAVERGLIHRSILWKVEDVVDNELHLYLTISSIRNFIILEDVPKTVVYINEAGRLREKNHITFMFSEGAKNFLWNDLVSNNFPYGKTKFYDLPDAVTFNSQAVNATLLLAITSHVPRAGGPMSPHKLTKQRKRNWNAHKSKIRIYSVASMDAVLSQNNSAVKTEITDFAAMTAYLTGTDANTISFPVALALNFIGIGGKSTERYFFKCIGMPHATAGSSYYYTFPGEINNGDIMAGVRWQYEVICNAAATNNTTAALSKIGQMMSSWGYPVFTEFAMPAGKPGATSLSFVYARFMWPGGFMHQGASDTVMQRCRNDLQLIASKMAAQKALNKNNANAGRVQLAEIPESEFSFFKKAGPVVTV